MCNYFFILIEDKFKETKIRISVSKQIFIKLKAKY